MRFHKVTLRSLAVVMSVSLLCGAVAQAKKPPNTGGGGGGAPTYTITDLPGFETNGVSQSRATALSNPDGAGVLVVGESSNHAILWKVSAAGAVQKTDLGTLAGSDESEAVGVGVNDAGMIVGTAFKVPTLVRNEQGEDIIELLSHAVVFLPFNSDGPAIVDLGPGHGYAINNPVNEFAQVSASGKLFSVGLTGQVGANPVDLVDFAPVSINNSGTMVHGGYAIFENGGQVSWDWIDATLQNTIDAGAMDDAGAAVGVTRFSSFGFQEAFLSTGGETQFLGTLGGPASRALGVNVVYSGTSQAIQVVGAAEKRNLDNHAFVWLNGEMHDLNGRITADGWNLFSAVGVNSAGQIAGNGAVGSRKNRQAHAYLLTSIP